MQPFILNRNTATNSFPSKSCFNVIQNNEVVWNFIRENTNEDNIYLCGNRRMVDEICPYGKSLYYSPIPEYCIPNKNIDINKKKSNLILYNNVYQSEYCEVKTLPFQMVNKRGQYYRHMLYKCKYGLENRINCIRSILEALGCGVFCFIHNKTRVFCDDVLTEDNHLRFTCNEEVIEYMENNSVDHQTIIDSFKESTYNINLQSSEILNQIIKDNYNLDKQ